MGSSVFLGKKMGFRDIRVSDELMVVRVVSDLDMDLGSMRLISFNPRPLEIYVYLKFPQLKLSLSPRTKYYL